MRQVVHSRLGAVVAGAATFALLSGGVAFGHGLIGSEDIRDNSIAKRDIGRDAVGSAEVLNGSLGMRDLNGHTKDLIRQGGEPGPTGPRGEQGETGPAGPAGPPGDSASVTYVDRVFTTSSEEMAYVAATCPAGTKVVNGSVLPGNEAFYSLNGQYPDPAQNAWMLRIGGDSDRPGEEVSLTVRVVCLDEVN